jgi:hypothetical protein
MIMIIVLIKDNNNTISIVLTIINISIRLFQESLNWFNLNSHIPFFPPNIVTSLLSQSYKISQPSIDSVDIIFFTMIFVVIAMQVSIVYFII